jgi:hypothetical protein
LQSKEQQKVHQFFGAFSASECKKLGSGTAIQPFRSPIIDVLISFSAERKYSLIFLCRFYFCA